MNKRRRPPRQKSTPIKRRKRSSSKCSELSKTITPDKEMDGTLPYDMDKVDDSEIQGCSNMDDNVLEIDENVQISASYVDDKSNNEESAATNTVTKLVDSSTQTVYNKYMLGAKVETIILKNKTLLGSTFEVNSYGNYSIHKIMASDQTCKYFTGLDTKQLEILYHFLGPAKYNLIYWNSKSKVDPSVTSSAKQFSIREQLMITLIRLRRGWNIFTLVHTYDTSDFVIRQIFTTWLQFMFHHFKDYLAFPPRCEIRKDLPGIFKPYKNIRASIDCTEFKCEVPRDYGQQSNCYSSYKHHTTMKCLIAVTPHGAACFVPDMYEGSIDDVTIFDQCGIMDHVNEGGAFLVDRGFTIQEILLRKQATIFIPPFLKGRDTLTKEEVFLTKRIAKARIHVERFNERLKKFRLLDAWPTVDTAGYVAL